MKSRLTNAISLEDAPLDSWRGSTGVLALKESLCLLDAINALAILTVVLPMGLASRQLGNISAGSHGLATTVRKNFLPIWALDQAWGFIECFLIQWIPKNPRIW
jgi:hypothetical protein